MGTEYVVEEDVCVNGTFPNICPFRFINGGLLALIGLIGVFLNLLVMYIIAGRKVDMGRSNQMIFMFNLAISDLLVAIIGAFRGFGIISSVFVGYVHGEENWWCSAYLLIMMMVSYSNCPCMVALTLDRFVAIVWPFRHRTLFTRAKCIILCVVVWAPQLLFYCWFLVQMNIATSGYSMEWYANYHRCTNTYSLGWLRTVRYSLLVWAPFACIILMYIVIIYKVMSVGLQSRRLLLICTCIVITGSICWAPSIFSSILSISMNYRVGQVLTVTLYYCNSTTDPLIYMLFLPQVKEYLIGLFKSSPNARSNSIVRTISGTTTTFRKNETTGVSYSDNTFEYKAGTPTMIPQQDTVGELALNTSAAPLGMDVT